MLAKYSSISARQINEATVLLYGEIGEKVDGDYLAREIIYLDSGDIDNLIIRINSMGGSFLQGLSIIGAVVAARANVIGLIEGIAGSMSAVIALSCDTVKMNDFARIMLHSPYYRDENGERLATLSEDERSAVEHLRNQMNDILTRRGKSKEEISEILSKDTWYTAREALDAGFIDEIIDTGMAQQAATLSIDRLVAFAQEYIPNSDISMKKVAAKLGLPETATEDAIIAALDQRETTVSDSRKKLVDAAIAAGRRAGTVNDSNEVKMRRLAETDMELFAELAITSAAKEDNVRISEVIAKAMEKLGGGDDSSKEEKNWDWYQKNDPVALREMKTKEPDKYKKLYEGYWNK